MKALLGLGLGLAAGCEQPDLGGPEVVLPDDYRDTFVEVMSCRVSVDHELSYVVARANPEAAPRFFNDGPYPFPVGTLIAMEQYNDPTCSHLVGWTLMSKQSPGYHPSHGDWRWIRLGQNRRVNESGKLVSCTGCHTRCQDGDFVCGSP